MPTRRAAANGYPANAARSPHWAQRAAAVEICGACLNESGRLSGCNENSSDSFELALANGGWIAWIDCVTSIASVEAIATVQMECSRMKSASGVSQSAFREVPRMSLWEWMRLRFGLNAVQAQAAPTHAIQTASMRTRPAPHSSAQERKRVEGGRQTAAATAAANNKPSIAGQNLVREASD